MEKPARPSSERPSRSDAVRNRAAILDAAAAVFASRGHQVDVREIARCAGVGMGTLYRHFPTKGDLVETVLREDFAEWTRAARHNVADQQDPWQALSAFLKDALARQASHRALVERFAESWETTPGMAACRRELHPVIDELVARCHAAGVLRNDVSGEDISLLLVGLGRIAQLTGPNGPELWRRPLEITLDGLRPRHGATLPTSAPTGSPRSDQDAVG